MVKINKLIVLSYMILLGSFSQPAFAVESKDTLVVGLGMGIRSLDSATSVSSTDFRVANSLFDGLVKYKEGSTEVQPGLATHWKTLDQGGKYIFFLRQGVKFHDGTEFNAQAVKFSFDRVLDKTHPYHFTGPFPLGFLYHPIQEVRVLDRYTVEFQMKNPYGPFMELLAFPIITIVSPEAVKKYGKDFKRRPVGTGVFKFAQWKVKQQIVFKRNDNYWGEKAKVKTLVFRPFVDDNVRLGEMFAGGLDMMIELPPDSIPRFKQDSKFKFYSKISGSQNYYMLNMKEPPFNDQRMRHAVNYAINKQAIIDNILKGAASLSAGPTPEAMTWAHNSKIKPYPYDPQKAKRLIREAGYKNKKIDMHIYNSSSTLPSITSVATAVQADLAKVGLEVEIKIFELNTYAKHLFKGGLEGKTHIGQWGWNFFEPNLASDLSLHSDRYFNPGYYSNPEVDLLIEKAQGTIDQSKRAEYYKKMQEIVNEDAPWIFFLNSRQLAVSSNRVQNFKLHPSLLSFFAQVYKN